MRADRKPGWPSVRHWMATVTAGSCRRKGSGVRLRPIPCWWPRRARRPCRASCSSRSCPPWADCCTSASRRVSLNRRKTGWMASWNPRLGCCCCLHLVASRQQLQSGDRCFRLSCHCRRLHLANRRCCCSAPPVSMKNWACVRQTFASCWRKRPSRLASWLLHWPLALAAVSGAPLRSSAWPFF